MDDPIGILVVTPESLFASPNVLAADYSRFRVGERLLLTGHSHQAWPDAGFAAQARAWEDAAEHVDEKWEYAFAQARRVRAGFARLLGETAADIALASNTHELVVRWLSALPLQERPRIVTTDGEFHTIRRQLDRLEEDGRVVVVKIPATPVSSLAGRIAATITDRTAAVMVSSVMFRSARIVPGLDNIATACRAQGTTLLVDAYHHMNVIPFSVKKMGLEDAFIVGGGYKYCQLGEGNCFLRIPQGCELRPIITGWYSEFDALTEEQKRTVPYGQRGNRFAGATYDPASHYRAATVFEFFVKRGLTPEVLREVSQHQVGLLADHFDALDLDPDSITRDRSVAMKAIGGFLTLTTPRAAAISEELRVRGVSTDYRGDALRFGPAPYLSDSQLAESMNLLGEVCRSSH